MYIQKSDVLELRRRMTKKDCTFTRLCGCYVNAEKEVLLKFSRSFADMTDEVFFKYLEIAKKSISGSLSNNLLELRFQKDETGTEYQRFLYTLKASKLKNEALLDRLYEKIIASYDIAGNYLILTFHDVYDVMAKGTDRKSLGESSESYEYMIVSICPVDYSKAGLSYHQEENSIDVCERFWMVGAPEIGFTYPAFAHRSADANAVLYYVKTGKNSHPELINEVLGCDPQRTAGEEKNAFRSVIEDVFQDEEQAANVYLRFQRQLGEMTASEEDDEEAVPIALTKTVMADVITQVDMPEEARAVIQESFAQKFGDQPPQAQNVVDKKLLEESQQRMRTLELETRVTDLNEKLDVRTKELSAAQEEVKKAQALNPPPGSNVDIALRVTPQKARKIHAQMVGSVKYLLIPLEKDEATQINGEVYDF